MKKTITKIAFMSAASLLTIGIASQSAQSNPAKDDLVNQMAGTVEKMISVDMDEDISLYSNIDQASKADSFPAKLDLRDRGVVPAVRSQGIWGTCWGFASIGACEISILSELGQTTEEYQKEQGSEMDLSERHLAWFSSVPVQETEDMNEEEKVQVGEGRCLIDDDGSAKQHLDIGGLMGFASDMFASGIGPIPESLVPYTANDGSDEPDADWSVDEDLRYQYAWELKDSSILPTPAGRDENGNYVYNEVATEMMKQELLDGCPVTIAYHADQAMDPEADYIDMRKNLIDNGFSKESVDLFIKVLVGKIDKETLSDDEWKEVMKINIHNMLDVDYADITDDRYEELCAEYEKQKQENEEAESEEEESEDQGEDENEIEVTEEMEAAARAAAEKLGIDYDEFMKNSTEEKEDGLYMNTDHYAQYVYETDAAPNHAVCIIGYDDTYPASNFLKDHQPPADGAWIVRNSWGADYGNDGYFYLSYYDQSIMAPESFEFVTDADSRAATGLEINQYDYMPAASINVGATEEPVYMANEFTVNSDSVLSSVSCMTANLNTNVTAAVYLLNEDAKDPTDGQLLDVRTVDFKYAGYHRIALSHNYKLAKGSKISVVETQRYKDADGLKYALPYTLGLNRAYTEVKNDLFFDPNAKDNTGIEGKIGRGESFVSVGDTWMDWVDLVDDVKEAYPLAKEYMSFDNLSIKSYMYKITDIESQHNFGEAITYGDGQVKLCTDCGYSLVEK